MNQAQAYDRFLELEDEYDLFGLTVDGAPVWERVRFDVFRRVAEGSGLTGQAHTSVPYTWSSYLRGLYLWLKNGLVRNPFLGGQSDVLVFGLKRRKRLEDGYWWDIYTDPIYEAVDLDYLHIEEPDDMKHQRPPKTESLAYTDFLWYGSAILRNLGLATVDVPEPIQSELEAASGAFEQVFGVDPSLTDRVRTELEERASLKPLYVKLVERVDPSLAVVVTSYGKETFVEACSEVGVPVAELQHGVIYDHHPAYSFPGDRTKHTFPDYLFTWGEFWNEAAPYPIPSDRVVAVGYPYLERRRAAYSDVSSSDRILFLSQGAIGERLSKFAVEVAEHPEIEFDIVYKLHPGEYDRWRTEYPWLVDADLAVVDSSGPPLYRLFAESRVQVGVYSTAIYEGLSFGLETYLYDTPGVEALASLVAEGAATMVASPDAIASTLGTADVEFDRERFFQPNATASIAAEIDRFCTSADN